MIECIDFSQQMANGAPFNNKCPEFSMILKPNWIIYTGSASSQHTWHMRQGVAVNRSAKKVIAA